MCLKRRTGISMNITSNFWLDITVIIDGQAIGSRGLIKIGLIVEKVLFRLWVEASLLHRCTSFTLGILLSNATLLPILDFFKLGGWGVWHSRSAFHSKGHIIVPCADLNRFLDLLSLPWCQKFLNLCDNSTEQIRVDKSYAFCRVLARTWERWIWSLFGIDRV